MLRAKLDYIFFVFKKTTLKPFYKQSFLQW